MKVEDAAEAVEAVGRPPSRHPFFHALDRCIAWASEVPAAILVVLEIVVLLAGVVSRYVFTAPLTWSDELASVLFLWLAMLGAVIALRRGEHMRLSTLVNRLAPPRRSAMTAPSIASHRNSTDASSSDQVSGMLKT